MDPVSPQKETERKKIFLLYFLLLSISLSITGLAADEEKTYAEKIIERRQKTELLGFFLKDPKDAKLPKTSSAIELFNDAMGYYQKNEYDLAIQALQSSLQLDDQNPYAYQLLGDIYNNQQNLKEAKMNYEIAYNLRPGSEIKSKLEQLGQEVQIEKKLSTYREEHFLIKYQNKETAIEGFELREMLRQTYRDISKDFAYYFKHQVVVLLYDAEDFKKITNLPHWVGGVYDGKVRMPLSRKGFNEKDLKALTTHEVTHAFVAAMSGLRAPAWINEGLAQYEENKVKRIDLTVFKAAMKTKTLLPMDQLISQELGDQQDALWVSLFYQQSFQFTQYLIDRYGMFVIKKMLGEFAQGKNSDEAIRAALQVSPVRLEKEWLASISK